MSDIDLIKAADATLKYIEMIEGVSKPLFLSSIPEELSLEYQKDLLGQIIKGTLWGEKAHRCFGWAQGALVINGIGDLVVYRMINYCSKHNK